MPNLKLLPTGGRFQQALQQAVEQMVAKPKTEGKVEINLLEKDGKPWLLHPKWGMDPDQPGRLFVWAKDLFVDQRFYIVDRAADLRSRGYWMIEYADKEVLGLSEFQNYLKWSEEQRGRLHRAILMFELNDD